VVNGDKLGFKRKDRYGGVQISKCVECRGLMKVLFIVYDFICCALVKEVYS
jgi:hypothetical protein